MRIHFWETSNKVGARATINTVCYPNYDRLLLEWYAEFVKQRKGSKESAAAMGRMLQIIKAGVALSKQTSGVCLLCMTRTAGAAAAAGGGAPRSIDRSNALTCLRGAREAMVLGAKLSSGAPISANYPFDLASKIRTPHPCLQKKKRRACSYRFWVAESHHKRWFAIIAIDSRSGVPFDRSIDRLVSRSGFDGVCVV